MSKENKSKIPLWAMGLVMGVLFLGLIGGLYAYNDNQKSITGDAISNLEEQLKNQNKILETQGEISETTIKQAEDAKKELESQIEELSQVTCKDIEVPYDAQESYTVQEPYLRTEEYSESEPYIVEECEDIELSYNHQEGSCIQYKDNFFSDDEPATYSRTINNLDSEAGGTFFVNIGFRIGGVVVKEEQNAYIYPQSSHTFYAEQMAEINNCYFTVDIVPTKQVCEDVTKYKNVLKTRQVTDYKAVTKERTVTKYRTETVCD